MLATPDGMFSFGAQCTGTDCPAAEQHVVVNSTTLPKNVAGVCMKASGPAPYLMDAFSEWYQWNGTTFASAAAPAGGTCGTSPYSADGSSITPTSGSLINAAAHALGRSGPAGRLERRYQHAVAKTGRRGSERRPHG